MDLGACAHEATRSSSRPAEAGGAPLGPARPRLLLLMAARPKQPRQGLDVASPRL